ncbi:Cytosolic sorting protein GGA2/TOM1 [Handroanthus impetiginosus]|uniref:Cytosolic sorting protein GGA2/TOM1 n=1 Tax=Handroanthus impetiginosus TaxID=429701 RepID=A0A2G9G9G7_9LAMI|nr:Cytosolic sorting protein GGA2/TOM1 [Handroanthus impetiginosus]
MISSMASISSSSAASVRVEKATSEFLIGPDWTLNIDICDAINSNQMLAKDVVKAVKKRLQHKNPKVQLLALTLLETMVKNCGDYVHFQIAERNIPQEMVKIVRKKTDMHVRDKVLTLIASWHQAFGGSRGRYTQYYLAYEDLRADGVEFPRAPDAAPIFTPPVTHPIPIHPQPGYGMPSSSSTRLDEAMAAEENLSLSSLNAMRNVLDLLTDMLQAVNPNDRTAVKDEVIIDLVEQCRANQKKLMQMLGTTGDEELLGKGLELNDSIQGVLAKHDAIASGSPLPPEVKNITSGSSDKHNSSLKSGEVSVPNATSNGSMTNATSNGTPSAPIVPAHKGLIDEEDEEEDDFAQLARRHSKNHTDASQNTAKVKTDVISSEASSSPAMSNALVPIDAPTSVRSKDQDIIDLLSMTLSTATSTEQTSEAQATPQHTPGHVPSSAPTTTFASEAYPANAGLPLNNYVAPWAQPQAQPQPQHQPQPSLQAKPEHQAYHHFQPQPQSQPQPQPPYQHQHQPHPQVQPQTQPEQQPQRQPQYQSLSQPASHPQTQSPQYASAYPPPPWAPTPGYFTNQNSVSRPYYTYSTPRPTFSSNPRPFRHESINGETQMNSSPTPATVNPGQKPFIPSYRLFEDLNVFGNTDGRFKATSNASPSLSGSNNQNMVGGRK